MLKKSPLKTSIILILVLLPIQLMSQKYHNKIKFPIYTFHTNETLINGLSLGFYSHLDNNRHVISNGLRLEVPGIGFLTPVGNGSPVSEITELKNKINYTDFDFSEIVNGINISSGSWGEMNYNGITIALIAQHGRYLNGIGLAGVWNAYDKANGISTSFLLNEGLEHNGIQLSLSNTVVSINGIQIGARNYIFQKGIGLQMGIANTATNFKGIQLGIWNKNQKRTLPFINWNFN